MNEEEIKKELRKAFGLGENDAEIEKKILKDDEKNIEYWEIKASEVTKRKAGEEEGGEHSKETGKNKKFSTEIFRKYNIFLRIGLLNVRLMGRSF